MEKELTTAVGASVPKNQEQNLSAEAKCPVTGGAARGPSNRDWWPNQLRLDLLHDHSSKSNPMREDFDYDVPTAAKVTKRVPCSARSCGKNLSGSLPSKPCSRARP